MSSLPLKWIDFTPFPLLLLNSPLSWALVARKKMTTLCKVEQHLFSNLVPSSIWFFRKTSEPFLLWYLSTKSTCAFCRYTRRRFWTYTRKRFEPTHGKPLSLLSFSLSSSSLPSFSFSFSSSLSARHSFFLWSFLFSYFFCLQSALCVSVLNDNDNDRSSSWLSLYTWLWLALSARVRGLWPIPCWANMFASRTKQLSRYSCASLVPLGMKWAWICVGNGCCVCVWLCLVMFGCDGMCCLRCVVGCVSVVWWWRFYRPKRNL